MSKRLTQEEVIRRFRDTHGNKYDYTKVEYKNRTTKVCVICPIHGEFWISPAEHWRGTGCVKCLGLYRITNDEFVEKARLVHGDKYDYTQIECKGSGVKVKIICPIHGVFFQTPYKHLSGQGCPHCARNSKMNTEEFIRRAKEIHGDFFDYSKVEYKGSKVKVCIICPIHGEFWQEAGSHLAGNGCKECGKTLSSSKRKYSQDDFITMSRLIHGDFFDYSKVEYKNATTPVCIICPEHGEFWQKPTLHLHGCGCPKCWIDRNIDRCRYDLDEFIKRAIEVHGDKYDYSKVKYKGCFEKICIICPIHGEFWQTPANHLYGQGCPYCKESHGEREIAKWFDSHDVKYERQYKVIPEQVLFGRNKFLIDFYLPDHNIFIEFHGEQHYKNVPYFDKGDTFAIQQDRDIRLRQHCKKNKIRLIEIPYTEFDNIDKILTLKLFKSKKK